MLVETNPNNYNRIHNFQFTKQIIQQNLRAPLQLY